MRYPEGASRLRVAGSGLLNHLLPFEFGKSSSRLNAKLQAWIGLKRLSPLSIACRRRITGAFSHGFGRMNNRGGTNRWIGIHPKAGWSSCSRRPKTNPPRISIASGRREREIGREPPVLGTVPLVTAGRSETGGEELRAMAARPASSVSSLQKAEGEGGPVHGSGRRPLPRTRKGKWRHDYVGPDRLPHGL